MFTFCFKSTLAGKASCGFDKGLTCRSCDLLPSKGVDGCCGWYQSITGKGVMSCTVDHSVGIIGGVLKEIYPKCLLMGSKLLNCF